MGKKKSTSKRGKSSAKSNGKALQVDGSSSDLASLSGIHRPLSLVAQVERTLRSAIENNIFPNGHLPTILALADQLSVGKETVRVALESLQEEGLVIKRRRRGTSVQFSEVPKMLSQPRSKAIGYLCEEHDSAGGTDEIISGPCSIQMLKGAISEASQSGYQLNIRSAKPFQLRDIYEKMEASGPMCGVIFDSVDKEKFVKGLSGRGTPAILLDHEMHLPSVSSIRSDSVQNAGLVIRQLAELGHQRIACVHWHQTDWNPWFIRGYRKGMREVGLRYRRPWEMFLKLSSEGAEEAVEQLLSISPRPTAIICFHNTFARQFMIAALERGLRVPEDISVVGCGGEEVVDLTCTQLDWDAMGRSAVKMLLRVIDQGEAYETEHILVPYEWRAGGTTASIQ